MSKVEGIPVWMVPPLEALTPEGIATLSDADNVAARLERANVMIVRVPCP